MTKTSKAAAASSSCKIATGASKKKEPTKKDHKPKVVPAEEKPKRQVKKNEKKQSELGDPLADEDIFKTPSPAQPFYRSPGSDFYEQVSREMAAQQQEVGGEMASQQQEVGGEMASQQQKVGDEMASQQEESFPGTLPDTVADQQQAMEAGSQKQAEQPVELEIGAADAPGTVPDTEPAGDFPRLQVETSTTEVVMASADLDVDSLPPENIEAALGKENVPEAGAAEGDADSEKTLTLNIPAVPAEKDLIDHPFASSMASTVPDRSKFAWESSDSGSDFTARMKELGVASSSASSEGPFAEGEPPLKVPRTRTQSESAVSALSAEDMRPLCMKCKWPTDIMNSICKHKASATAHAKFICRVCNNCQTMLNRNLKLDGSLSMNTWTPEKQIEFWRKANKSADSTGRLQYSAIRGFLKDSLISQELEETSKQVSSEFLPLSVWETKGYDITLIAKYDQKEWNPACGWVYAVPIKKLTWSQVSRTIEEGILSSERAVKTSKKALPPGEDGEELAFEDSLPETPAPRGAPSVNETPADKKAREKLESKEKAAAARAEAQAAKAAQQQQLQEAARQSKAVQQHNNKIQILASKATTFLTADVTALESAMKGKAFAQAPDFVKEKCESAVTTAKEYLSQADKALKSVKAAAKKGTKLDALSFENADLQPLQKRLASSNSDLKKLEKVFSSI